MAFDIGASVSMLYQVIGVVLLFAGIGLIIYIIKKYVPGMGKKGTMNLLALFSLIGLIGLTAFGSILYVQEATATISGSADNQEVMVGGVVYVTWTGLTKDAVYSVTVGGVTCSNFTAPSTSYSHTVTIPSEGANSIILYNSSYSAQKTLLVYGKPLASFIPEPLINALVVLVIGIVILLGIAAMIIGIVKGFQMWG